MLAPLVRSRLSTQICRSTRGAETRTFRCSRQAELGAERSRSGTHLVVVHVHKACRELGQHARNRGNPTFFRKPQGTRGILSGVAWELSSVSFSLCSFSLCSIYLLPLFENVSRFFRWRPYFNFYRPPFTALNEKLSKAKIDQTPNKIETENDLVKLKTNSRK